MTSKYTMNALKALKKDELVQYVLALDAITKDDEVADNYKNLHIKSVTEIECRDRLIAIYGKTFHKLYKSVGAMPESYEYSDDKIFRCELGNLIDDVDDIIEKVSLGKEFEKQNVRQAHMIKKLQEEADAIPSDPGFFWAKECDRLQGQIDELKENKYDKFKCQKCKGHHTGCANPTCDTCVEELKTENKELKQGIKDLFLSYD